MATVSMKGLIIIGLLLICIPLITAISISTFSDSIFTTPSTIFKDNATVYISATDGIICCKESVGTIIVKGNPNMSFPMYDSGTTPDDAANNRIFRGQLSIGSQPTDANQQYVHLEQEDLGLVYIILNATATGIVVISADYTPPSTVQLEKPTTQKGTKTVSPVALQWSGATDSNGINGYFIYRSLSNFTENTKATKTTFQSTTTIYNDTSALEGKTYYYGVSGVDKPGTMGLLSNVESVYVPDVTPPEKITTMSIVAQAQGAISLSWTPPNDTVGVQSYRVYRNTAPITTTQGLNAITTTTNAYKDTQTIDGTMYFYAVSGVDFDGNVGVLSNNVNATADATGPGKVSLSATPTKGGTISLTWSSDLEITNGGKYSLYRSSTPFSSVESLTPLATLTTNTSSDTPVTTVYYGVVVEDKVGNRGQLSSIVGATPDATPPLAISGLSALDQGNLSVLVQWQASPSSDLANYVVYRTAQTTFEQIATTLSLLPSKYVDASVQHNTTYYYRVHAVDAADNEENNTQTVSVTVIDHNVKLEVLYPQNNSNVDQDTLILLGVTDINATVNINATGGTYNDTYIDNHGSFLAYVFLEEGTNTITLFAQDALGNEKTVTLVITNQPSTDTATSPIRNRVKRPFPLTPAEKTELKRQQDEKAREALAQVKQQQQAILASPQKVNPAVVDTIKTIDQTMQDKADAFKNNLLEVTAAAVTDVPSKKTRGYWTLAGLGLTLIGLFGYMYYLKPKGPEPSDEDIDKLFEEETMMGEDDREKE